MRSESSARVCSTLIRGLPSQGRDALDPACASSGYADRPTGRDTTSRGRLPQPVLLPLLRHDRRADLVAEGEHLHVVGRGAAGERELVPLALAFERAATADHGRIRDLRDCERADDGLLGLVDLVLADALHRLEIADLLEARVGI